VSQEIHPALFSSSTTRESSLPWKCPSCDLRNVGAQLACASCDTPRAAYLPATTSPSSSQCLFLGYPAWARDFALANIKPNKGGFSCTCGVRLTTELLTGAHVLKAHSAGKASGLSLYRQEAERYREDKWDLGKDDSLEDYDDDSGGGRSSGDEASDTKSSGKLIGTGRASVAALKRHPTKPSHPKCEPLTAEEREARRKGRLQLLLDKTATIMLTLQEKISAAQATTRAMEVQREAAVRRAEGGAMASSPLTDPSAPLQLPPPPPAPITGLLSLTPGRGELLLEEKKSGNPPFLQPSLLSRCTMRDYQLSGLSWLLSLHDQDLNGILADEMGLGKTLQVLAFLAHLSEHRGDPGPHLIVAPLSVLENWRADAGKFSPLLASRVLCYHGLAEERPRALKSFMREVKVAGSEGRIEGERRGGLVGRGGAEEEEEEGGRSTSSHSIPDMGYPSVDPRLGDLAIVVTTYELAVRDVDILGRYKWKYCIVDEGHRLKRAGNKLGQALLSLSIPRRILLTGTPLQNNLTELWALLNFCLPTLFTSAENFAEWFSSPFAYTPAELAAAGGAEAVLGVSEEEQAVIVERLHAVLRPFLLRRIKTDVLHDLPTRTEVIVPCAMSALQATLYLRTRAGIKDFVDPTSGAVRSLSLSFLLMRLRQVCNHPYLLSESWLADGDFVRASGKFATLYRLLPKLHSAGHRMLIFSQFTTVLDLLEDLCGLLGMTFVRLDGRTKPGDRGDILAQFNAPLSPHSVFLLSTRAGGVGINLQTADTVILFDSDWNPQADLQAQSRAHRIGQKKDVWVFRLVSKGPPSKKFFSGGGDDKTPKPLQCLKSVEEVMQERARQKLRTEAAVIGEGKFHHGSVGGAGEAGKRSNLAYILRACIVEEEGIDGEGGREGKWEEEEEEEEEDAGRIGGAPSPPSQPFVLYSDAFINHLCARDEKDMEAFTAWDKNEEDRRKGIFHRATLPSDDWGGELLLSQGGVDVEATPQSGPTLSATLEASLFEELYCKGPSTLLSQHIMPLQVNNVLTSPSDTFALDTDGHHSVCAVCGDGGDILICDAPLCPKAYHGACLEEINEEVPGEEEESEWYCPPCCKRALPRSAALSCWERELGKVNPPTKAALPTVIQEEGLGDKLSMTSSVAPFSTLRLTHPLMQLIELQPLLKHSVETLREEEALMGSLPLRTVSHKDHLASSEREKLLVSGKRPRLPVHPTAPMPQSVSKRGRGRGKSGGPYAGKQELHKVESKGGNEAGVDHEKCTICGALVAKGRMQFHLFADHQL
jgi:hypothetical protein